ncbi:U3 small nucleolar RNA-associated protein 15 homolog [Ptychodera flava]|uniref:U3 small nucleolar RNA-associated protein 15 homolog n=1 Tax=Ptychodera flava TaxID=63121 RepID=UPI00396A3DC0
MAAAYKKTPILNTSNIGEQVTRDDLYWQSLEFPVTVKEFGAVSHIEFSPIDPHNFAVTSSARVQIYSPQTNQVVKTISRFKDTAYCGSFRSDGKLLVAGSEEGAIRLFDISQASRSILRMFRGHVCGVHVSRFCSDKLHIVSGGDDNTVRYWDIANETELHKFTEHKDYIRSGVVSETNKDLFLTGSYDHTAKLFDIRTQRSIFSVDHGQPIEAVLMFPNGNMFMSAGDTYIKVWDILSGGRLVATFGNHHKTVTSLCFNSTNDRLLAGSLDRHVKIYDLTTYKAVHSLTYPGAILSVALSPNEKTLVVGMTDGMLSIQHRSTTPKQKSRKKSSERGNYRFFFKHKPQYKPVQDDLIVKRGRGQQLQKHDMHFKKFEYSKALDAVLLDRDKWNRTPQLLVSVLQELIRRDGLKIALAGRDDEWLQIMLTFLSKYITNPRFTSTLMDVTNLIIEIYSPIFGKSPPVDAELHRLQVKIDNELKFQDSLFEVMGMLDVIFASSTQDRQTEISSGTENHTTQVDSVR